LMLDPLVIFHPLSQSDSGEYLIALILLGPR